MARRRRSVTSTGLRCGARCSSSPACRSGSAAAVELGAAVPWFPVVGALIGVAVGGVAAGLWQVVPPPVAAAVAGARRRADHRRVPRGRARRHAPTRSPVAGRASERLRDPRGPAPRHLRRRRAVRLDRASGSSCVASLAPGRRRSRGLVAAHALARSAAVGAMAAMPARHARTGSVRDYAAVVAHRRGGRGRRRRRRRSPRSPPAGGSGRSPRPPSLGRGRRRVARVRKIGGITGDVLGAVEQVAECLVLVVVTGLATRHRLWWR